MANLPKFPYVSPKPAAVPTASPTLSQAVRPTVPASSSLSASPSYEYIIEDPYPAGIYICTKTLVSKKSFIKYCKRGKSYEVEVVSSSIPTSKHPYYYMIKTIITGHEENKTVFAIEKHKLEKHFRLFIKAK